MKNSEHYPTTDNAARISVVHQGQALPEMVFLPEGKLSRSACTPDGTYRDEPCHFWIGATVPAHARTQDLAVRASWDDKIAIWPLEEGRGVRLPSEGQFQWPTARFEISGWTFHDPRNPDHPGIDIAAAQGDPVLSIADGEVTHAGWRDDGRGYTVVVKHADGWSSAYAQLHEIEVDVGQAVRQGEPVGRAGSTGDSSGHHLHFELRHDGDAVNPLHHLVAFDETSVRSDPLIFAREIRSETRTVDPLAGPPGPALTLGEKDPEVRGWTIRFLGHPGRQALRGRAEQGMNWTGGEGRQIMDAHDTVAIAFQFVEHINRRDLDGLTGLMTEDHTFVDLAGDVERGRDVMRQAWAGYFSAFPDYMIHVSAFFSVEDAVILVGRTTGSHLQLPRAVEFRDPVIWAARIRNDQVAEWRLYPYTPEARAELGIPIVGDF